jgi:hypothetical protein
MGNSTNCLCDNQADTRPLSILYKQDISTGVQSMTL